VQAAVEAVRAKTSRLHALVNNAGIGEGGLVDWMSMKEYRTTMETNFLAHVNVTKQFLPLLVAQRDSRIINLCSVAGFVAAPGMSAYAASKFAFEGFSDSLRREMAVWDIKVSIVEPGFMKTPIIENIEGKQRALFDGLDAETKERYGTTFLEAMAARQAGLKDWVAKAEDPIVVVNAICHAVSNSSPRVRYRPGFQSPLFFTLSTLPAGVVDWWFRVASGITERPAAYKLQHVGGK